MSTNSDKMKRYERLAVKNPKYYVSIGDLYSDDGDFKTATIYYQKAVDNGVLAYTVLGDTWGYRSQYKKRSTFIRRVQTKAKRSALPVSDFAMKPVM